MNFFSSLIFIVNSAFLNLSRSFNRTAISLLAIVAATASILVFESFMTSVRSSFRDNLVRAGFGHFVIHKKGYRHMGDDDLTDYLVEGSVGLKETIESVTGPIAMFSRGHRFSALLYSDSKSAGGLGVGMDAEEEKDFITAFKVIDGKHISELGHDHIVLGVGLAETLRVKVGDVVTAMVSTVTGSVNGVDYTVGGTFKSGLEFGDNNLFYTHFDELSRLIRLKNPTKITVGLATESEQEEKYTGILKEAFEKKHPDHEILHWREVTKQYDNTMGWLETQVNVFNSIVLIVAILGIANVFAMGLIERKGEFGTLRAIGTQKSGILSMVLMESFIHAILGSVGGVLLTLFICGILFPAGVTMPPPPGMSVDFHVDLSVPWHAVPTTVILATVATTIAAAIPAYKLATANIVESLGRNV